MNIKYHCDANSETGYHAHSKAFWSRLEKFNDGQGVPLNIVLDTSDHPVFYANYEGVKICYNVYESTLQPERFFNHILHNWDYFFCPSEWQAKCMIDQGFPAARVHVVPEGVDGQEFFPISDEKLSDKFTFIIVGKYEYRKATEEMINCWLEVFDKETYPDIKLVLSVDNMFDRKNVEHKLNLLEQLNDSRIEILHFPPRAEYINRLQTSHVFLSCSRSEGWGLPLIESVACGVPSIALNYSAQVEYSKNISHLVNVKEMKKSDIFPGEYGEPDFEHFKTLMKFIYDNWDDCRQRALMGASFVRQQFSWEKAVETAVDCLKKIEVEYVPKEKTINSDPKDLKIGVNFIDGVRLDLSGDPNKSYLVKFIDNNTGHTQYHTNLTPPGIGTSWASPSPKYFVNWKIEVTALAAEEHILNDDPDTIVIKGQKTNKIVFTQELNLKDQRVFINLDSKAMGDNIAWIPYAEEFRKKHNCKVIVSTFWNSLFEKSYPELEFVVPGQVVHNLYAQYKIGCNDNDSSRNRNNWREIPLQKVAADILGLTFHEVQPKISVDKVPRLGRRFVAISDHSTMQSKYWNHDGGWQEIIDYLLDIGYDVVALSKDPTGLTKLVPINNKPIEETTSILNNCDFFIGVGSGLSWLAWGLNKKVIMISGFSDPFAEFISDNYRLSPPPGICHGCFNDKNLKFERSWDWCPRNKNYECSRTITPEMVKEKINLLISHL